MPTPLPPHRRPLSSLFLLFLSPAAVGQDGEGPPVSPGPDRAQDPPPGLVLDPLLVTPILRGTSRFEAPATVEEIDARTIDRRAYRTVPQSLRDVPGILLQETAHGQGSPYLRGFTGFQNVLLIDGVRLNNSVFRSGPNQYWNTVDPFSVDRMEVVMGPSSVLYGSDALGGTVQVFTKSPWREMAGRDGVGGRVAYRWADAESYDQARVEVFGLAGEDTAVFLGVSHKEFGDLHGGSDVGLQRNTGYDEVDADLKIESFLDPDTRLTVAHQHVEQDDVPRTHRTAFGIDWEDLTVGSDLRRDLDQDRDLTYVQLDARELDGFLGIFDRVVTSVSWHEQSEERHRTRSSGAVEDQGFDVETLGFFAHFFAGDGATGRWTVGIEAYHDQVDSFLDRYSNQTAADDIQGPVGDDATYDLFGLFVQDEIALAAGTDLVLGVRANHAAADADSVRDPVTDEKISVDDDWQSVVGSVRITHELEPERLRLFGGVSQGFRAPNLSDLTRFDSARTDEFEIPAPDLDPERTTTLEIGVKALDEDTSAQVVAFYTDVEDAIARVPTGDVNAEGDREVTKDNVGDGYVLGLEVSGTQRLNEDWSLFGNLTWMAGRLDTFPTSAPVKEEDWITRGMPFTLRAGLHVEPEGEGWWAEALATYADDADRLSTRDEGDTSRIPPGGTPGYVVLDLRGGMELREDLDLTVAVENVFDEDYRVHGSGLNRPGRNLVVGLSWSF